MTPPADDSDPLENPDRSLSRRALLGLAGALVPALGDPFSNVLIGTPRRNADAPVPSVRMGTLEGVPEQRVAALALEGDTALVGMPPAPDPTGPAAGRAVLVTRTSNGRIAQTTLRPEEGSGQFGRAVELDHRIAAVGAPLGSDPAGDHAGSVTIFRRYRKRWVHEAVLRDPDSRAVDLLGTTVAADDGRVLVGAPASKGPDGLEAGAAFVFRDTPDGWRRTATLAPPRGESVKEFGEAVAIDGDTAVVGARATSQPDTGLVYVYGRTAGAWRLRTRLTSPDRHGRDRFGTAIAVSGDTLLVGAPAAAGPSGARSGLAHVYRGRRGDWLWQQSLQDPVGGPNQRFGWSIAVDGRVALVGSRFAAVPVAFTRSGQQWNPAARLRGRAGGAPGFGTRIALDGQTALVTAHRDVGRADAGHDPVEVFGPRGDSGISVPSGAISTGR